MARNNVWMSVSDLMTGLMIIFLFIAVAYMSRVDKEKSPLAEYIETKRNLHEKLVKEFAGDTLKWQMSIGKDLSMKFKNPTVLFQQGSWELTPEFKEILNTFLPRYFNILLKAGLKKDIEEIRIEGHTDNVPMPQLDSDPYIANVILSQRRSLSVLRYFRSMPEYQKYNEEQKRLLEFWFTSNGLSYGKSLDKDGNYTKIKNTPIDLQKSRRVEFRIVTTGEKKLEEFIEKNAIK